jgi:hypothetical protein
MMVTDSNSRGRQPRDLDVSVGWSGIDDDAGNDRTATILRLRETDRRMSKWNQSLS